MMSSQKGKVTLIATDIWGPAMGIRFLSAALRVAGFDTTVIFAQGMTTRAMVMGETQHYPDAIHNEIAKLVEGSLYVGISLLTVNYHKAKEITENLKRRLDIPVIWGGVHVMVKPEECLACADMICMGHGEQVVIDLAERFQNNEPYLDIPGLMLHGLPVNNEALIPPDITLLPKPDYSFDGSHYLVNPWTCSVFTLETYAQTIGPDYYFLPTLGCPYQCTYCINNKYARLYKGGKRLRRRSLESIMDELIWMKEHLPFIHKVIAYDDCFMGLKKTDLQEFATEYKKHIGLPFEIESANSQNVTEEKLDVLCDAGLTRLRVGAETGSERTRELFKRRWETNEEILEMSSLVQKYIKRGQMDYIVYDYIVDTPWENEQDQQDTFDLILSLKPPFGFYTFSLTFYPGTALYERARSEGLLKGDTQDQAYWAWFLDTSPTPINQALEIIQYIRLPLVFVRFLANPGQSGLRKTLADALRTRLHKFTRIAPEIGLWFHSLVRHEADHHCAFHQRHFDTYRKAMLQEAKGPRALIALRKLIGWVYLQLFVPGKPFCSVFYRKHQFQAHEAGTKYLASTPWTVSVILRGFLHL
jgi:anaerobic magnesium-protoporphyrin IX monomethyl ester cyclase